MNARFNNLKIFHHRDRAGVRTPAVNRKPHHRNSLSRFSSQFSVLCSRRGLRAQAIVEYAIVFPLQLMLTLAIIQLAHLFIAKHVIEYGAFCGARAALVGLSDEEARQAAVIPISTISGALPNLESEPIKVPGWGPLAGSQGAIDRTGGAYGSFQITRDTESSSNCPIVVCELTHAYRMIVPVGNEIVYSIGDSVVGLKDLERVRGETYFRMKGSCTLAYPWGTPP